jgi:hypothetical protein
MLYVLLDNYIILVGVYFLLNIYLSKSAYQAQSKTHEKHEISTDYFDKNKQTKEKLYNITHDSDELYKLDIFHIKWGNRFMILDTLVFGVINQVYQIILSSFKKNEFRLLFCPSYLLFKLYVDKKGSTVYKEELHEILEKDYVIKYYRNGLVKSYLNNKLHMENGNPAVMSPRENLKNNYFLYGNKVAPNTTQQNSEISKRKIKNTLKNF